MPTKRDHINKNIRLHDVGRVIFEDITLLPACRGNADGRSSFLYLPPDESGATVRRVDGRWERINLSKVILINPGSRIHDTIQGKNGTVLEITADQSMKPILRIRTDDGDEIIIDADRTHGAI